MFKIGGVTVFENYEEAKDYALKEFPFAIPVGTSRGTVDIVDHGGVICSLYLARCELKDEYPEADEVELDYCPHCDCLIGACMCHY